MFQQYYMCLTLVFVISVASDKSIVKKQVGTTTQCYSCEFVLKPDTCTTSLPCAAGENCYVLESLLSSGDHGYKLGCVLQDVCDRFQSKGPHVFGKRSDPLELSLNGECCNTSLCNNKFPSHLIGGSSIDLGNCPYTSTHCPANFTLINGKCYRMDKHAHTYIGSQHYCRAQCSTLAESLTPTDILALGNFIGNKTVFIGAEDPDEDGHFVWEHSGKYAAHITENNGKNGYFRCATLTQRRQPLGYMGTYCYYHWIPLCQAPMK